MLANGRVLPAFGSASRWRHHQIKFRLPDVRQQLVASLCLQSLLIGEFADVRRGISELYYLCLSVNAELYQQLLQIPQHLFAVVMRLGNAEYSQSCSPPNSVLLE